MFQLPVAVDPRPTCSGKEAVEMLFFFVWMRGGGSEERGREKAEAKAKNVRAPWRPSRRSRGEQVQLL